MRDNRGPGVAETSGYPALSNLLNEIGKTLKPKVRCVINPANVGAGIPDGGLFTPDQFQKATDAAPKQGQLPARGVVEVKGPADDVPTIARSEQVKRYSAKYGLVLVTNYRDFLLLGRDTQGNGLPMEGFTLADSEKAFWQVAAHPQVAAKENGERFCGFLKRVMLSVAPLSAPQDVAWFLGSYASDAKGRVENHKDLSALAAVRDALEEALGMKFTGEKGEHFFRSTLVQTIFYGVFSAWVLWHRERPARRDSFDWRVSAWSLRVPFIRALYDEVATPNKLGPLGMVEVLDWTAGALNRVDRTVFFQKFQDEHAVQYFYEPFMEAYDPDLRKELGVWYTPLEIVRYQVARVDTVLREELGLPDGLADPNVVVLDPCCGTGAYLVEVLKKIAETLKAKGPDALIASDLKKAAMERVFGFEIMPAPFVVSHLQLGLMLHDLGAPLSTKSNERVGVYLTNSLTGWEPPTEEGKKRIKQLGFGFPELQAERDAAEKVKRDSRILVILGNPPYNAFAGVSPDEEQGLVEPYKKGLKDWGITKNYLNDLYVRFFRLAERRIAEMTGRGVVSFISNQSWVAEPSFVVLRKHLLESFDRLWIENLHGNRKITEYAPDGSTSETIFARRGFSVGIQQGVATSLWVKTGKSRKAGQIAQVLFRDDLTEAKAEDRRRHLLATLTAEDFDAEFAPAKPGMDNRYSCRPENVSPEYRSWPRVPDLCDKSQYLGLNENRGGGLQEIDRERIVGRMRTYLDIDSSWQQYQATETELTHGAAGFDPESVRNKVRLSEPFSEDRIRRYLRRPFDLVWAYISDVSPLWNRSRPELRNQLTIGQKCLITRPGCPASPEGVPFFITTLEGEQDSIRGHAYYFPTLLVPTGIGKGKAGKQQGAMFKAAPKANLSATARAYLAGLGVKDVDADAETAGLVWMHALAVGYSPAYLAENADGIRRDWPRIPLPGARKALDASAALGRQVAALLDTESPVRGVTASPVEAIFRTVGVLTAVRSTGILPVSPTAVPAVVKEEHGRDGHATHGQDAHATHGQDARATRDGHATQLDADAGDLAVTVGWGHAGKGGVTMPAKGRIFARPYDKAELDAITDAAKTRGLSQKQALALLGPDTRDVYLNEKACWSNVPANVWEYFIGGYQVIKKWLSYREQGLLGRALSADEAREVTGMARRLAAIILLQPALDDNYRRAAANAYAWPKPVDTGAIA